MMVWVTNSARVTQLSALILNKNNDLTGECQVTNILQEDRAAAQPRSIRASIRSHLRDQKSAGW